jgi:hypothetical protein
MSLAGWAQVLRKSWRVPRPDLKPLSDGPRSKLLFLPCRSLTIACKLVDGSDRRLVGMPGGRGGRGSRGTGRGSQGGGFGSSHAEPL